MVLLKVAPAMVKDQTVKASSRKPTGPTPLSAPLFILEQTDEPSGTDPVVCKEKGVRFLVGIHHHFTL